MTLMSHRAKKDEKPDELKARQPPNRINREVKNIVKEAQKNNKIFGYTEKDYTASDVPVMTNPRRLVQQTMRTVRVSEKDI